MNIWITTASFSCYYAEGERRGVQGGGRVSRYVVASRTMILDALYVLCKSGVLCVHDVSVTCGHRFTGSLSLSVCSAWASLVVYVCVFVCVCMCSIDYLVREFTCTIVWTSLVIFCFFLGQSLCSIGCAEDWPVELLLGRAA